MIFKFVESIERFLDLLVQQGLDVKEIDEEGVVEITNPPYSSLEYVAPFVNQLRDALLNAGFTRTGELGVYLFTDGALEAEIRHVEADCETGPPIDVKFRFLTFRELPTVPVLPNSEEDDDE
jgi:hypothetical protein